MILIYKNRFAEFREFVEPRLFGVCTWLGEKMGLGSRYVRLFFIYAIFINTWSPVIIYMVLAFWKNLLDYLRESKSKIWDM